MKSLKEIFKDIKEGPSKEYRLADKGIYIRYNDGVWLLIDKDGFVTEANPLCDGLSVASEYAAEYLKKLITPRLHVWEVPEMFGGGKKRFYGTSPQILEAKREAVRKQWARIEEFTVLGDSEISPNRAFIMHEDKFYLVPSSEAFDLIIEHCGLGPGEHHFRTNEGVFTINIL